MKELLLTYSGCKTSEEQSVVQAHVANSATECSSGLRESCSIHGSLTKRDRASVLVARTGLWLSTKRQNLTAELLP